MPASTSPFDLSALQNALSDPRIGQMAETVLNDPAFQGLAAQLAGAMGGQPPQGAPAGAGPGAPDSAAVDGGADGAAGGRPSGAFDPAGYMQAMGSLFSNPTFMRAAEQLGAAIISSDPSMGRMAAAMADPRYKSRVEAAVRSLKDDPEVGSVFADLESGGPAAVMRYWNDPVVLQKLGAAVGDLFGEDPAPPAGGGEGAAAGGSEAEEDEEVPNMHAAASDGDAAKLRELLVAEGASADERDDEGRTPLHFAAGYGEIECARMLIEKGADVDAADANGNTALHYACGYGQAASVRLLLDSGADKAARNGDGKAPLDVARLNKHSDIAGLLE